VAKGGTATVAAAVVAWLMGNVVVQMGPVDCMGDGISLQMVWWPASRSGSDISEKQVPVAHVNPQGMRRKVVAVVAMQWQVRLLVTMIIPINVTWLCFSF
jgi:uncharacterized membrane protein